MADNQNPQDSQVPVSPSDQSAENLAEPPVSTPSASSATDTNPPKPVLVPDAAPQVSQISADSSQVPTNSPQVSADSIPPVVPTESASPVPAEPPPLPTSPLLPSDSVATTAEEKPPESLSQQIDINVQLPDNQPSQVQSEPSDNTSTINASVSENQSAEIKPESLEGPTVPSTPPENIPSPTPTTSFGDLLTNNPTASSPSPDLSSLSNSSNLPSPNPQPKTDNPQPSISFGDLLSDSLKVGPTINIKPPAPPVSSSNPPPQPQPQSLPQTFPASPLPADLSAETKVKEEASAKEGQLSQDKLILLRQQAKQKKAQKKEATIQKIIDLAKTRGKINNQEAQKILHLPQSTMTDYFKELVSRGLLKKEGKGKATYYHL